MNVEEIIEKKHKRKKTLKKIIISIIIIIGVGLLAFGMYKLIPILGKKIQIKNNENNNNTIKIEEKENEDNTEQQVGIGNGGNIVNYKGYSYVGMYDSDMQLPVIKRFLNNNEENEGKVIFKYNNKNGMVDFDIWIYEDNLYVNNCDSIEVISLDSNETKELISAKSINKVEFDFDKELVIYKDTESTLFINKLDGTFLKKFENSSFDGYGVEFLTTDKENIFYVTQKPLDDNYTNMYTLYKINKSSLEMSKTTQIELVEGWYGAGIYQAEQYGDYVYFVAGSLEGTGGFFNGDLYRVKINGTNNEKISEEMDETGYFSTYIVPEMVIYNNYIYYEGLRVNTEENKVSYDVYSNGDIFDDEGYEYTASRSTENKIIIMKFKAGTDGEDKKEIFTKDIPNGATVDKQKIKLTYDKNKIYVTIRYTDMDNRSGVKAWTGVDYLVETYKMNKDGSELIQL